MRIYVIDDEPRQRRGMEQLIRSLYSEADILSFNNGSVALKSMAANPPQIIISDIRMPHMTGLELAEKAHEFCPDTLVIFTSAYAEFEYAQKAISLGVFDYLIKPVQPTKVKECLQKAVCRIERARGENRAGFGRHALKPDAHVWDSLFSGDPSSVDSGRILDITSGRAGGRLMRVVIPAGAARMDGDAAETRGNLKYWFQNAFPASVFQLHGGRGGQLLIHAILFDPQPDAQRLDLFRESIEKDYGLSSSILLSGYHESLPGSFAKARYELDTLEAFLFYHDAGVSLVYDSAPRPSSTVPFCTPDMFFSLTHHILSGSGAKASSLSRQILQEFASANPLPDHIRDATVHILLKTVEAVYAKGVARDTLLIEQAISGIRQSDSFAEMAARFTGFVQALCERIRSEQNRDTPIQRAMLYVNENYAKRIALSDVAKLCHYSVSYFSSIFKAQTGESFISYLNSVRLRQAVFLLSSTSLSIYEISNRVGFSDIHYFGRLFKRKFGMTAQAYRDSLAKEGTAGERAAPED